LISFGISEENMRVSAITGLIVDIEGTGPESIDEGGISTIALRADMDALPMPENNPKIPYRT
jgi:metal-dependent amidase/aminoacylase/carboxypeptidase family protein